MAELCRKNAHPPVGCVIMASGLARRFGSNKLLADFAREQGSSIIIKGLRAVSDFEREFQMALMNHKLNPGLDTMFLTAEHQFMYLSSSAVKELARYDADVSDFLPAAIIPDFKARMMEQI